MAHRPPIAPASGITFPPVDLRSYRDRLPDVTDAILKKEPLERAHTIPSSWFTHPGFHEFERALLFRRSWQYAGHLSELDKQGSYRTTEIGGNPIVVVRGRDGVARAFYNVCRHRGGPLAVDERGCTNVLQCKYHGWTYLLDGTLRGVPKFDRTELFDRENYGLVQVSLDTWEGLLFVCLQEPPAPLALVVDGIADRIAPLRLDALAFYRRVSYDVRCNWKVYVDNYLEGYHVPLVHPALMTMLDYRNYVTRISRWYSLQYSPLREGNGRYGGDGGEAYYYYIFPNLMLNVLPGRLQTNVVVPEAPDRTRVVFDYYYTDTSSPQAVARAEEDVAFSDRVQREDIEICEHVQRGLASDAYDRGRFSPDAEEGVHHFHSLLKEQFAAAFAPPR